MKNVIFIFVIFFFYVLCESLSHRIFETIKLNKSKVKLAKLYKCPFIVPNFYVRTTVSVGYA